MTVLVNIGQMCAALQRHAGAQCPKAKPNQMDPAVWVYDLGENGTLSVDAGISDNVQALWPPSGACRTPRGALPPPGSSQGFWPTIRKGGPGGACR